MIAKILTYFLEHRMRNLVIPYFIKSACHFGGESVGVARM